MKDHIQQVRLVCFHRDATEFRLRTIMAGQQPPTLDSRGEGTLYYFSPDITTAAYLVTLKSPQYSPDFYRLQQDLDLVDLPSQPEFEPIAHRAERALKNRGLRSFFSGLSAEDKEKDQQALQWVANVDPDREHTILSGIDALLGSTPHHDFSALPLFSMRELIEQDLRRRHENHQDLQWVDLQRCLEHNQALSILNQSRQHRDYWKQRVTEEAEKLRRKQTERELATADISLLEKISPVPLRTQLFRGYSISDLAGESVGRLTQIHGVGEKTATHIIAAAQSYAQEVHRSQVPLIDFQNKQESTDYVRALSVFLKIQELHQREPDNWEDYHEFPVNNPHTLIASVGDYPLLSLQDCIPFQKTFSLPSAEEAWNDYRINAASFHAYGDSYNGTSADFLSPQILDSIEHCVLQGNLHTTLRGYQAFGTKFALVQSKVLLGDEMGLGKTIQALALCAHAAAIEPGGITQYHAIVVCPPSLRINWCREIEKYTDLPAFIIHGSHKESLYAHWQREGGIAIMGYPEIRQNMSLLEEELDIDTLIVDEAHRAKNPQSLQSQAVHALTQRCPQVLYLTGTPLENNVREFSTLLSYLDPEFDLQDLAELSPRSFMETIAPRYLRRNQSDVLQELPPITEMEEWVEPSIPDQQRYQDAVMKRDFMAMRQAGGGSGSAKIERVHELLSSTPAKTIIFSFFRDTCTLMANSLSDSYSVFGPLMGGVSPEERQSILDSFSDSAEGSILIAQINTAGEGLNIQSARRVIIMEPQLNPAIEAQAIARVHRMGQIHTVEVHRMLNSEGVDTYLTERLAHKRSLFDTFARESITAQQNPSSMDISDQELIKEVIAAEHERLAPSRL